MRPERFIHSPYRLGPNRHDALGIPYPAVRAMIKPSRRGEMVRFNPELWINLTEFGRARLGSPCRPVRGTAGGSGRIAGRVQRFLAVSAVFCNEISAKPIIAPGNTRIFTASGLLVSGSWQSTGSVPSKPNMVTCFTCFIRPRSGSFSKRMKNRGRGPDDTDKNEIDYLVG